MQIVTENLPSGGELNIWCEFTYHILMDSFQVLSKAWVTETVVISKKDKTVQRKYWCELPSVVLESKESILFTQDGRDTVPGRLIYGAWNRKSVYN